ncbi:hypothetical protein [Arenicella sp. 4NH20-0111]
MLDEFSDRDTGYHRRSDWNDHLVKMKGALFQYRLSKFASICLFCYLD